MTTYLMNASMFNTQMFNGPAVSHEPAGEMKVLFNQTTIDLNWTTVEGATHYRVQVSLYPDFRTTFENTVVSDSDHQFTDSQTDNQKRYWRWRPSMDGAASYMEPWSEVGSYWLDTGASTEVELARNKWAIFDPDDVDDQWWLDIFPLYRIIYQNLYRIQERNRLGELLSEFLTIKSQISLMFQGSQYLEHRDLNELRRFHNNIRTFFIATFKDGERQRPMPNIWKVEFTADPAFTMIAAGRQDLLAGSVIMEEV